jgi:hypothetical protein
MKSPAILLFAFSASLSLQAASYLPLQTGNSWLYRLKPAGVAAGDPYRSISVGNRESLAGHEYYDVTWFGRQVLLREDPATGAVLAFDRASGSERPWLAPSTAEGSGFPTTIDPCSQTGTVISRNSKVATPAGEFENAVQVAYRGPCADAGVTREVFVPEIGLVLHEETSFTGPREYELTYYRSGSRSAAAPEVAFTLALDAARYSPGAVLEARLTLRSTIPQPITLEFPSGQSYDLKITDSKGEVVYLWSAGRAFTMIYRTEAFGPGEKTYGIAAPLENLNAGRYQVEAWLTTSPVLYRGTASFEIAAGAATAPYRDGHPRKHQTDGSRR